MDKPLISVIVPVYNVEPYLDRCVQSIVDQTYTNLEIILVDDGSPDNCPALCDAWAEKDSRIRVIHKENGGLSDARNAGMAIATGEYIAFVDSDDWISTNYIQLLYQAIDETGSELSACDIQIVTSEETASSHTTADFRVCTTEGALSDLIQGVGFRAVAWNKLYKASLLAGEIFPVGRHHEDEFFTYRIIEKAAQLVFVSAPLYFYFQRPGSIMNTYSPKRLDALDAYLERLTLLKDAHPSLYQRDKAQFCVSCAAFYCDILAHDSVSTGELKQKIRNLRRQVTFSFKELGQYPAKKAVYIIGTRCCLDGFCRLLNLKRGKI